MNESSRRIMVVDDDSSHRKMLAMQFSSWGYEVVAVESAERALSELSGFSPHVIVSDIRMQGMDGFELLAKVRRDASEIEVLMVTAFSAVEYAIDAMKLGAYDYLVKPLDLDHLEDVLTRCFRDRDARVEAKDGSDTALPPPPTGSLIGRHPSMLNVFKLIGSVSCTRTPVLVTGETGTGKELVARTIHENSNRSDEPFVSLNCTAVPDTLIESELFGHVKGAFTGAVADRKGRFELARKGTILLDEVGDTSIAFQAKLLRVLQEREFLPVGGEEIRRTDARVVAATRRPVREMVAEGGFREDLYFRLRVIEIPVPALRERKSDIPLLTSFFLARICSELDIPVPAVPKKAMASLLAYDWPGNVRELENTLTRATVLAPGSTLSVDLLFPDRTKGDSPDLLDLSTETSLDANLEAVERRHVQQVLMEAEGNKSEAARILKISRPRLDRIIDRHSLIL